MGSVVDQQGVRLAGSKLEAVAALSPPKAVEGLGAFWEITGHPRKYVER